MVKSELLQALSAKLPELQARDVETALNCLLKQMADALAQGERIEIRGFGSFDLRRRLAKLGRNPKPGVRLIWRLQWWFTSSRAKKCGIG